MLQLAGNLRGRALQEWELLTDVERSNFESAVEALRKRLDPGGKMLAAQDFRHASQRDDETVADFICRLAWSFKIAYGRDGLSLETQHAFLPGQLHEGLKFEVMRASSVSGTQTYQAMCFAAKNEEHHLAELKKRQQYLKSSPQQGQSHPKQMSNQVFERNPPHKDRNSKKACYQCGEVGHLASQCKKRKSES